MTTRRIDCGVVAGQPAGTPSEPRGYRVIRTRVEQRPALVSERAESSRIVTPELIAPEGRDPAAPPEQSPNAPELRERTAFERHVGQVVARAGGEA